MWHENLLEIIKESGLTKQQIAEKGNLPYETVKRVVSGKTDNPYIETLDRFAIALKCTLGDILIGTKAVVGTKKLAELQETIDILSTEKSTAIAERDLAIAENTILKDKVTTLTAENDILRMQLSYKDEIIALQKLLNQAQTKIKEEL